MRKKKTLLSHYTVFEIVLIALLGALGLATKPVIVPIVHLITGPLFIPGGSVAGGFYMLWIVLGASLIHKRWSATLIALVQGIIVCITGSFGTHGILSILTYSLPGLMIDIAFFIGRRKVQTSLDFFIAGAIANISGTYLSNLVFFRLPLVPLILSLSLAILSGGIGGLVAYGIYNKVKDLGIEGIG